MCRTAPRPPPALHRSHQGIRHCEPSCTLGDTQQPWMPTSICTDHPLLPWWHVLQGHRNGDASDPFPVSNGVKQGCVLAPTLFSLLFAQMLSAALSQTEAGVKIHYRTDAISSTSAAWSPTPKWLGPLCKTSSLQMTAHLRLTPR